MSASGLLKEFLVFFRNRTAAAAVMYSVLFGSYIIFRSAQTPTSEGGPFSGINQFHQNYMIMLFPAVLVNILITAFSVTAEKESAMLSRLIPAGSAGMLKVKACFAALLTCLSSGSYFVPAVLFSVRSMPFTFGFSAFLFFSTVFFLTGLSTFTVFFAFRYFGAGRNFEPDVKMMLIYMLCLTVQVLAFYFFASVCLKAYYEYAAGFRIGYPNRELLIFLTAVFLYMILSRITLRSAEKHLSGGVF